MTDNERQRSPLEEPLAWLERNLMGAYIAGAGQNLHDLLSRDDEEAKKLLAAASLYASERLTEIEARSHYLQALRGEV